MKRHRKPQTDFQQYQQFAKHVAKMTPKQVALLTRCLDD